MQQQAILKRLLEKVIYIKNYDELCHHFPTAIPLPTYCILDVETNGRDYLLGDFPFALGISFPLNDNIYVISYHTFDLDMYNRCQHILSSEEVTKVGHNFIFDLQMCCHSNIPVNGKIDCTLLMSRLFFRDLFKFDLKSLGAYLAGDILPDKWNKALKDDLKKKKSASTRAGNAPDTINYSHIDWDTILQPYLENDVLYTLILYNVVKDHINRELSVAYKLDIEATLIAMKIENFGLPVDVARTQKEITLMQLEISKLYKDLTAIARKHGIPEFNPASPAQVKKFVLSLGVPEKALMKKGKVSTDKETLEKLEVRFPYKSIAKLVLYRMYTKMYGTYLKNFLLLRDKNDSIHCKFKIDTKTGRFSSAEPNLQNIPRPDHEIGGEQIKNPIRNCIKVRRGYRTFHLDYSQIEVRWFAYYCQEEQMLSALRRGDDIHGFTAELMFGDREKLSRQKAKSLNFGFLYGMGKETLSIKLKESVEETNVLYSRYLKTFPGLRHLQNMLKNDLYNKGYIQDFFGRRYYIDYRFAYKAVNALIQGVSANTLKLAMITTDRIISQNEHKSASARLILTIHDEVVLELPVRWSESQMVMFLTALKHELETLIDLPKDQLDLIIAIEVERLYWGDKPKIKLEGGQIVWEK